MTEVRPATTNRQDTPDTRAASPRPLPLPKAPSRPAPEGISADTLGARIDAFLRHPKFPVDIRHNAKIGREKLAVWAATRLQR